MAAYAGVAVVYNDRLIIQVYSTDEKKKTKRIKTIALAAQVGVSNIKHKPNQVSSCWTGNEESYETMKLNVNRNSSFLKINSQVRHALMYLHLKKKKQEMKIIAKKKTLFPIRSGEKACAGSHNDRQYR